MGTPSSIAVLALLLLEICHSLPATAADWGEDFEAARTIARAEGKDLLVYFTSSDGCLWCRVLERQVLETSEFERALDNFVFVKLDFPVDETASDAAKIDRNRRWKDLWGVIGFPTIVLSDADGRPFGWLDGVQPDGPAAVLEHFATARESKTRCQSLLADGERAAPADKADLLHRALSGLPLEPAVLTRSYRAEIEAIIARTSDKVLRDHYRKMLEANDEEAFQAEIKARINERAGEEVDSTLAIAVLDEALNKSGLSESRRKWLLHRKGLYRWTEGAFGEAAKAIGSSLEGEDLRERPANQIFYAQLLFEAGHHGDAVDRFDDLANAYSALPEWRSKVFDRKAQVLQQADLLQEAIIASDLALTDGISPQQLFHVQSRRSELLRSLTRFDEAIAAASQAIAAIHSSEQPQIFSATGLIHLAKARDGAGDAIGAAVAAQSARQLLQRHDPAALSSKEIATDLEMYPHLEPVEASRLD